MASYGTQRGYMLALADSTKLIPNGLSYEQAEAERQPKGVQVGKSGSKSS